MQGCPKRGLLEEDPQKARNAFVTSIVLYYGCSEVVLIAYHQVNCLLVYRFIT